MEQYLAIVSDGNKIFSGIKPKTPKMISVMKELCIKYKEQFKKEFKLKVIIKTSKGFKFV